MTDRSDNFTTKDLIKGIRKDLGLETESVTGSKYLNEAYVAMPKQYDLPTELLSKKAKTAHKNLYQGYIEELNRISAELDAVNRKDDFRRYRDLKRAEIYNLNAVYLHELFFANVSDVHSEITMDTLSYMRLERDFGNFNDWQYDFVANAMGKGNGWAVCAYSTYLRKYINFFVQSHDDSIPVGCYPVIVVDVWEHAYFRDYLENRKAYVYAMMKELNWEVIEERFKRAERIGDALR